MKTRFLAPVILSLFLLPGCASLQALGAASTGTIASVAPDEFNAAKRSLTAAHDLHASTARFLTIAANSNLCTSACAVTAKGYLDRSEAALKAADALIAVSDAPGINAKITTASLLLANVNALIGKK